MRNEIGKWFMDVAKYVATAVLISSFLGNFEEKHIVFILGLFLVVFFFLLGVFIIKDNDNDKKKKKLKK